MRKLIIISALCLASCTGSPVVLTNGKQVTQCNVNGDSGYLRELANDDCAKAYESLGYRRVQP